MKKKISFILVLCIIVTTLLAIPVFADTQYQIGDNVYITLSEETGIARVYGNGDAYIRDNVSNEKIKKVIVENGVTDYQFSVTRFAKVIDLSKTTGFKFNSRYRDTGLAEELILPKDLSSIDYSINGDKLKYITIYPATTSILRSAFYNKIVRGYTGSYAEQYAKERKEYGITFESIGTVTPIPTPTPEPSNQAKKGENFSYKGLDYKVMSVGSGVYSSASQVRLISSKKNSSAVSIPNTVLYKGQRFRVTSIYTKAFYKDTNLRNLTVGKYVNYVGSYAFYGCNKLNKINILGDTMFKSATGSFRNIYNKAQVSVPKGKVASYRTSLRKYGLPTSVKVVRA